MCSVASVMSTLCDSMDCSSPGSSIHWILQAGILKGSPCPAPGDLPNLGIKPLSPARQVIFFFPLLNHQRSPSHHCTIDIVPIFPPLWHSYPFPSGNYYSVFCIYLFLFGLVSFFFFFISFETSFLNHKLFRGLWLNCLVFKGFLLYFLYCFLVCSIGEGNGTPLQYSCLENPMDKGAW